MLLSQTTKQRENLEQSLYESVLSHCLEVKKAGDETHYSLSGRLYLASNGYLLLSVPNAVAKGLFDALDEQGVELPLKDGRLNAHITVMSPDEVEQLGGPEKITERGHAFRYNLGPVKTVKPSGWANVSKVWFCSVSSPDLQTLRKAYGLSPLPKDGKHKFHITFAIRKSGVLQNNETKKAASFRMQELVENKPVFLMNELVKKAELPFQRLAETDTEHDDNRPKKRKLPWWLLGTGAVGATGLAGAYGLASDEHVARINQKLENSSFAPDKLDKNETGLIRYSDVLSTAAGLKPFGVPVGNILTRLRTQPWLLKKIKAENYSTKEPGAFLEGKQHYDSFAKGPISAYYHMSTGTGRGKTVLPAGLPDPAAAGKTYKDYLIGNEASPGFDAAFTSYLDRNFPGHTGRLTPHDITLKEIPYEEQRKFMREYIAGLPEAKRKTISELESGKHDNIFSTTGMSTQAENYKKPARLLLSARDALKTTGMTAGGAAAGGALGHYLYNRFSKNKRDTWKDKLLYAASTLGGAAAGGALSYYAGTTPGHKAIEKKTGIEFKDLPYMFQ